MLTLVFLIPNQRYVAQLLTPITEQQLNYRWYSTKFNLLHSDNFYYVIYQNLHKDALTFFTGTNIQCLAPFGDVQITKKTNKNSYAYCAEYIFFCTPHTAKLPLPYSSCTVLRDG